MSFLKKKKKEKIFSDEINNLFQQIYLKRMTRKKKKNSKRKLSGQKGHNKRRILGILEGKNR